MTKAQEQIRLHRVDAAATRVIPKSAYWHLRHRPYREGMPMRHIDIRAIEPPPVIGRLEEYNPGDTITLYFRCRDDDDGENPG